jgi:hypothetical protein
VIVIGDSDDSYDFLSIRSFVEKVNEGYDLVMGSRFKGGIAPGAMPPLHRYVGNPVLTGILNLFFGAGISDAHCGMRAFTKSAYERMRLKTGGMEFASEMVIRSAQEGLRIAEIPTTLSKDGRDRPPHRRSFRDGWRHLRFMLMFSPRWLFMVPGLLLILTGGLLVGLLPFFRIEVWGHVLSYHFSILGSLLVVLGATLVELALFATVALTGKQIVRSSLGEKFLQRFELEAFLVGGIGLTVVGLLINGVVLVSWVQSSYGAMSPVETNFVMLASTMIMVGVQMLFASFFLGILRGVMTDVWVD